MPKILQFVPPVKAPRTRWDELAALSEIGAVEYQVHQVLLAASWAYQVGMIKEGDDLIKECRAQGFSREIILGKRLGDLMHAVDFGATFRGTLIPESE